MKGNSLTQLPTRFFAMRPKLKVDQYHCSSLTHLHHFAQKEFYNRFDSLEQSIQSQHL